MKKLEKYRDLLFSTLSEITSLIIGGTDKRMIFEKLLNGCLVALEAERVYLLELDGSKIIRYSKVKGSSHDDSIHIEVLADTPVLRDWMLKEGQKDNRFAKGGELAFDLPFLASQYLDDQEATHQILSAPLVAKKSIFGLLVAIHGKGGGCYASEDERLITVLANQAAIALENRQLYQKLEKEAITDGLTGVYNYRFLVSSLEREVNRARRFAQLFSFAMIDVDNLKQYNDRLGHLCGSQALKEIAAIIKENCREIDLVSKYGGDEFSVIMPQTGLTGALVVIERVIEAIGEHKFDGVTKGLITCSAGLSTFPTDGDSGRSIIASADKALYQAKRMGKNMVSSTKDLVSDPAK